MCHAVYKSMTVFNYLFLYSMALNTGMQAFLHQIFLQSSSLAPQWKLNVTVESTVAPVYLPFSIF